MAESAPAIEDDPFALGHDAAPGARSARIEHRHCVGRPGAHFMFGGAGMALAARAIEGEMGEPPRWLTLQFVAPTPFGARLDLSIERLTGDRVTQLALTGQVGGETVLRGLAATGGRGGLPLIQAETMPPVPAPAACPAVRAHHDAEHDVHQNVEIRLIKGRFGIFSKAPVSNDGHVHVWMRPVQGEVDVAMLGFMADFVPSTTANALGVRAGGSSLDNVIRIARLVPTEWIFCDIAITAIADGIGHGQVNLFAEDGTLLAVASQSFVARVHPARAGTLA